ncbi:MAG TPA: PAS domain-containing protein, partial [Chitinophagaceae bacterium]|nr:PAS domain-containing protein [Chitinophagaceae bacterium]
MDAKLTAENIIASRQQSEFDSNPENAMRERLSALELQLKIFKQAESIGDSGNWQINLNTFETWYSDNVFRIYGLEPYALKCHPDTFNGFLHEEDRHVVLNAFEKSYTEKIPLHLEFRIRRQDGTDRHLNIVSSVTKNSKGEPLLTGITQDITERKNLEIKFRESVEKIELQNETFRHAEQIGLFGTLEVNLDTRQVRYSDNFYHIFGLKQVGLAPGLDEFILHIHPDDQPIFKEVTKKIFGEQLPPESAFRILRADGKTKHVQLKSKLLRNADGHQLIVGVIKDITSATKLEKQLKEINEQLQVQNEAFTQAEKTTDIGSWTWNLQTNKVQFSDNIYILYGLKSQSIVPSLESFVQFIHPMDRPSVQRIIAGMKKQPGELDFNYRVIRPDGKTRYIRTRSHPITSPAGDTLIIGTTQDLTDDVVLHQQLKERIHFAEMLSENIPDKVCITNSSNIIIGWNSRSEMALQLKKEEVIGKNIFDVLPKIKKPEVIDLFKKALNGEVVHVSQIMLPYIPGQHELTLVPIREENEDVTAVLILLHDISEHLEMKSALEERLEFIEKLTESSVDRIMVLDKNMCFQHWNKKSEEHYGLPKEKVVGKNILEVFPSFRKEIFFDKMKKAWNGETLFAPVDRETAASNYSESFLVPIKNRSHQVMAVLWIEHDLTELISAEKDLKISRDLLQSVFDTSFTGIAVFESIRNEVGEIIDFEFKMLNEYAQSIYGDHLIGKRQLEVYPGAKNEGFFELNKQVVETGIPVDTEKFYSGEGLSGWFRITAAKMGDGLVVGFDDISDRKRKDEEMLKQRSLLLQAEEIANLGSWEFNPKTNSFTWSDQIYRIYDYAPQSFVPTLDFYLSTTESEDREMVKAFFETAKETKPFSITHRLHTLD